MAGWPAGAVVGAHALMVHARGTGRLRRTEARPDKEGMSLLAVPDAGLLEVAVVWGLPYGWSAADDRTGPWLNRAGSQVQDQDHPVEFDADRHCCRTCGHDAAYRADRAGICHTTPAGPAAVLAEVDRRAGWPATVRRRMAGVL
jgi:hypothetical protein